MIQIISAYCQINDCKYTKKVKFDKLISNLNVLTQNMLQKDDFSVLSRIYTIFSEKSSNNYLVSNLIIMLIYSYSLLGEECYYTILKKKTE
jgi:hypothetical protein